MATKEMELSENVINAIDAISSLNAEETKEFAIAIRKHSKGKLVYEAYYGFKDPSGEPKTVTKSVTTTKSKTKSKTKKK